MSDAKTPPYDEIPPEAFALATTPFDYIVVGSGAGGGPLAARLALGGMRVLVLEAGKDLGAPTPEKADENDHAIYHCPGLHTASTEPEEHGAQQLKESSYYYHVRHYSDATRQNSDPKAQPYPPNSAGSERRQWYPRSRSVGGCTAHYAMIAVAPPDADWQYIADLTGDSSWRPELMRFLFSRLERFTRGKHLTQLGYYWNWLLDRWNPDRHRDGLRGDSGWLDISFTNPQLALGDSRLTAIIKRAAVTGHSSIFAALWRWAKRGIRGRFYEDLDLNDARTISSIEEGMAFLPLAVSSGINSPWSSSPGMRRGPRERLFETRDLLFGNRPPKNGTTKSKLAGYLYIVPDASVERVIFHAGGSTSDPPRAVGVKLRSGSAASRNGKRFCYARREIVISGGAFESPKLLMLSGIGDAAHLAACKVKGLRNEQGKEVAPIVNLPGVGRNLGDRYEISVISRMNEDWKSLEGVRFTLDPKDPQLNLWRDKREGIYATNGGVVALLYKSRVRIEEEKQPINLDRETGEQKPLAPDIFLMGFPAAFRGYYPGWSKDLLSDQANSADARRVEHRNLWSWTILKAWSRNAGEVRLNRDDLSGPPDINFHYFEQNKDGKWQFNPQDPDLLALVEAVSVARRVNREANSLMRKGDADEAEIQPGRQCADETELLRDWIVRETWGHHACGTCSIGKDSWQASVEKHSDHKAVVDSKFRVHGVTNLRVVDASVFPKIPGYFLAVPTFMIAEKAADTLLAEPVAVPREVRACEAGAIRRRRERANGASAAGPSPPAPHGGPPAQPAAPPMPPNNTDELYALPPETVGLALSGGGIRSATFCLGVVQSLAKKNLLRGVDYISTASGGGYTGAFLGGLFQRVPPDRPDPVGDVQAQLRDHCSAPIRWLRNHASYLVSEGTSDWWQFISVYLRNLMTLYLVILTVGFAVFGTLEYVSSYLPADKLLERFGVARPEVDGIISQSLYAISPWWLAIVFVAMTMTLPASIAYWLSPQPGSKGYVSFFAILFWIVLCLGFITAMQLPNGFGIGAGAVVVTAIGIGYFVLFRTMAPRTNPGTFFGRMMRNRATRLMSYSLMWLAVAVVWTVIDTLARLIAEGHLLSLVAGWAVVIAPWLPFVRGLSMPVKNLVGDGKESERQSIADRFPRFALILAFALLGFLLIVIDAAVHLLWTHDRTWGFWATIFAILLSLVVAQAIEFLNGSTLLSIYTARLSRTFLGASSGSRLVSIALNPLGNIRRSHPSDDIPFDRYQPHSAGGPLHLIGICVNETVDAASQREIADRRSLPMCVGPCGVSVGTRFHAVWEKEPDVRMAPPLVLFRKWLNGFNAEQARVLRAIPIPDDPFHVLANKDGGPAFVELLTLGQWIGVSGAAFGTGLGRHTNKGASILAGLANARLGYWWDSGLTATDRPGVALGTLIYNVVRMPHRFLRMQHLLYSEWMGRFAGPTQRYWNLSDGGHFDNTAVYELIRRRVQLIFAIDGSADPTIRFDDIADLIRHVRTDFGAEIDFQSLSRGALLPADLPPWVSAWFQRGAIGSLEKLTAGVCHAALARITWSDTGQVSWLVYIKASASGDEPADVTNYKRCNPVFPSEPTTDQFFKERQWESYRLLGQHIGERVFAP